MQIQQQKKRNIYSLINKTHSVVIGLNQYVLILLENKRKR